MDRHMSMHWPQQLPWWETVPAPSGCALMVDIFLVLQEKETILKQKDELIGMLLKLGCSNGATPEKKAMLQIITNQFNAGQASPTTAADAPEVLAKASVRKVVTPDPRIGQENASPMQTGGLSF